MNVDLHRLADDGCPNLQNLDEFYDEPVFIIDSLFDVPDDDLERFQDDGCPNFPDEDYQ